MPTEIQKGDSILRPRARLIKTIGEELISNDVVAVMELVKNSYDADASIIVIEFKGRVEEVPIDKKRKIKVLKKENSSLSILDDGRGMSLETIKSAWMEPATISKKIKTVSPILSRRYTGEKGIGRFASAKLSTKLNIITREADDNEVLVDFNWEDFADDNLYLDEVKTKWEVRPPLVIKNHGTSLALANLNSDWDEDKIRSLKVALSRIVNPVAPIADFLIELNVPIELSDFTGIIEAPDSIKHPDYSIKGNVNSEGIATITYNSRNIESPITFTKDLVKAHSEDKFTSGPFSFEFRVWDREQDSLDRLAKEIESTVRNVKADLDELTGISIYRDNFRVLPYGEIKNDWLRLNARRINNPTMRVGVNQIVGYVSIGRDSNSELTDQSNREGIVDSVAFADLQEQVRLLLNELEIKRYDERPRRDSEPNNNQSLYSNFSISNVRDAVKSKLPNDKEVLELVEKTQIRIDEGVKKVQEVLARYRRLSTLGQLLDSILHDGGNFLLNIDSEVRLLTAELKNKDRNEDAIKQHLEAIEDQRKIIAQLFKRLQPFGGRKKGRPSTIVLEDSIKNVFELKRSELDQNQISTILPTSVNKVTIDDGELQMIILNLLQNSMFWLNRVENRQIIVQVERTESELSIIFSDSGPGISEENSKSIFDPYYTTREDGIGLGLTIVGELVSDYNGDLYLLDNGPLDGATFKIVLRKRI